MARGFVDYWEYALGWDPQPKWHMRRDYLQRGGVHDSIMAPPAQVAAEAAAIDEADRLADLMAAAEAVTEWKDDAE